MLQQALEKAKALRARKSAGYALQGLVKARAIADDLAGARQRYREALAATRAAGAERVAAITAITLAEAEFRGGDGAAALRLADQALPVLRAFHDTANVANVLYNMAAYLAALHRYDEACAAACEALAHARDAQYSVGIAFTLQHLAAIAALRPGADRRAPQDLRRAAHILGYVGAQLGALKALREHTEQQEYDATIPRLRHALGADELSMLMTVGETWSEDQAIAEATLI